MRQEAAGQEATVVPEEVKRVSIAVCRVLIQVKVRRAKELLAVQVMTLLQQLAAAAGLEVSVAPDCQIMVAPGVRVPHQQLPELRPFTLVVAAAAVTLLLVLPAQVLTVEAEPGKELTSEWGKQVFKA
jgi:hypothetical protein